MRRLGERRLAPPLAFRQAGKLTTSQLLSPRFMWMAAKETDPFITRPTTFIETEGTSLKTALDVARKFGVVRDTTSRSPAESSTRGRRARSTPRPPCGRSSPTSTWAPASRTGGTGSPTTDRSWCASTWTRRGTTRASTSGNLDTYNPTATRGGHAVALVGYTADRFIVRNSWGTGWGDKGFAYASLAYAQEAFTEAYGVEV